MGSQRRALPTTSSPSLLLVPEGRLTTVPNVSYVQLSPSFPPMNSSSPFPFPFLACCFLTISLVYGPPYPRSAITPFRWTVEMRCGSRKELRTTVWSR